MQLTRILQVRNPQKLRFRGSCDFEQIEKSCKSILTIKASICQPAFLISPFSKSSAVKVLTAEKLSPEKTPKAKSKSKEGPEL